jgi:hypothetical protein
VLASAFLMLRRRPAGVAAIFMLDAQSQTEPSGSMKYSVLPPKQPGTRPAATSRTSRGGHHSTKMISTKAKHSAVVEPSDK